MGDMADWVNDDSPEDDSRAGWDDDYYDGLECLRCDGECYELVCVDDICRGLGYCIHDTGGYAACLRCGGSGTEPVTPTDRKEEE